MRILEDIESRIERREHFAIPEPAMAHLESMQADSSFLGTMVLGKHILPVVFAKISARTARKIGFAEGQFLQPNYKWNMIEDGNQDLVGTLSLMRDNRKALHLALDPAHQATIDFLTIIKKAGCFFLDLSVVDNNGPIFGTTELMEVDGDHLEWVGRNLLRCREVAASNNWQAAFKAFLKSHYTDWGDQNLQLIQADARLVNARFAEVLITRGETSQPLDLGCLEQEILTFNFDWIREEHGIQLIDDEGLLTKNEQLRSEISKFREASLTVEEARQQLERMRLQYPREPIILSTLLKIYQANGGSARAIDSVLEELSLLGKSNLMAELLILSSLPQEVFSEIILKNWEHKEAADRLTADRPLTVDEFLLFEQLMIPALVYHERLPEAIRRFSRLVGFAPKGKFLQPLAEDIVRKKIELQIKSVRKIPAPHCNNCWTEADPAARKLLADAYQDHISFLKSELKKKGLGVAPEPSRQRGVKISRNAPCPCGSGKKYKRCCGK